MNNHSIYFHWISIFLILLFSCQQKEKTTELDKYAVEKEVRQMFDDYHEAIKKDGLKGEFKFLDQSEEFFWVPPGYSSALYYDSIAAILSANDAFFQSIEFHWDTLNVFPLSNTIANYTGIVCGTMVDTIGNSSTVSIIETGIVIKREDGWKLLSGQSANMPTGN